MLQGALALALAYNAFGFSLLHQLDRHASGSNVFISPTSVATALAIVADGAQGTTRAQILQTLGASDAKFDADNAALLAELHDPGNEISFSLANALWLNPQLPVLPQFVTMASDVFAASAKNVPFGDPSAAETINAWVAQHTSGLIPKILDSTSPDDVAVITNAIAMKAKWIDEFDKSDTRDRPFTLEDGTETSVSMMQREGSYAYAQEANWQAIRLPYRGDRFAMYVFLPKQGLSLSDAVRSLTPAAFETVAGKLTQQDLVFAMPRFTATFQANLNAPLSQLGMKQAFEAGAADFSSLVAPPKKAYVSSVVHRAFVRVDEEGTEAAAATAVVMRALAVHMPPQTRMIVDRPFLMAIRDDKTKQILFLGEIYKPERVTG